MYPLANVYKQLRNITLLFVGKLTISTGPFSIALLNHCSVCENLSSITETLSSSGPPYWNMRTVTSGTFEAIPNFHRNSHTDQPQLVHVNTSWMMLDEWTSNFSVVVMVNVLGQMAQQTGIGIDLLGCPNAANLRKGTATTKRAKSAVGLIFNR